MPYHTVVASLPRLCDSCPKRSPVYALSAFTKLFLLWSRSLAGFAPDSFPKTLCECTQGQATAPQVCTIPTAPVRLAIIKIDE
jgi:hypothetical protein